MIKLKIILMLCIVKNTICFHSPLMRAIQKFAKSTKNPKLVIKYAKSYLKCGSYCRFNNKHQCKCSIYARKIDDNDAKKVRTITSRYKTNLIQTTKWTFNRR